MSFFTMDQLLVHLIGDFILQPHYVAVNKCENTWIALLHGIMYTIPFLYLTYSFPALSIICGSHVLMDRFRLATILVWLKNGGPLYAPWKDCMIYGYKASEPLWLVGWLTIIADNILHVMCNSLALWFF